jgi:hypothetical protein
MTVHDHRNETPPRPGRMAFLVDGCPRCEEYVELMGRPFDPGRFASFWRHMLDVEFDQGDASYVSALDSKLGGKLYLVALSMQAAFNLSELKLYFWGSR